MMEGSHKNRLQEICQRRKTLLPNYEHERIDIGWKSTVTLGEDQRFSGVGRTKKEADQIAANEALNHIDSLVAVPEERKTQFKFAGCALILIDLENSPGYNKEKWENVRWDCSRIEAFVGKLSSHATKDLASLYPFVDKFHVINSSMKDAVDHAMSVRAGCWLESMKHPEYYCNREEDCVYDDAIYIISRDRFAAALIDVIQQRIPPLSRPGAHRTDAVHSINIDQCFQSLAS